MIELRNFNVTINQLKTIQCKLTNIQNSLIKEKAALKGFTLQSITPKEFVMPTMASKKITDSY